MASLRGHSFWNWQVGDLTLILSGVLPPDGVSAEVAVVLRWIHLLCELQVLVIEDPLKGDSIVI
jgi:hypothetical protein